MEDSLLVTALIAMLGGAIRVSTPFMFVALGECLTEKSGRVNLGLEGSLVLGAMVAYAGSYQTGNPWFGVFFAGLAGMFEVAAVHGSANASLAAGYGYTGILVGGTQDHGAQKRAHGA